MRAGRDQLQLPCFEAALVNRHWGKVAMPSGDSQGR
jgi:hypothetical protein